MFLVNLLLLSAVAETSVRLNLQDGGILIVDTGTIARTEECHDTLSELPDDILLRWLDEQPMNPSIHTGEFTLLISSKKVGIEAVEVQGNNQQLEGLANHLAMVLQEEILNPACDGSITITTSVISEEDMDEQPEESQDFLPGYVLLDYSDLTLRRQIPLLYNSGNLYQEVECVMRFYVGRQGKVDQIEIIDCPTQLHSSVREAGKRWRFKPARDEHGNKVRFYWEATHTVIIQPE